MIEANWIRDNAQGKIFSVRFVKKNGESRDMVCRLGVQKGVNGQGMAYDPADHDLLCVYDVQRGGFRMVNLATVDRLTVGGVTYERDMQTKGAAA